jgi:hypothetical protein
MRSLGLSYHVHAFIAETTGFTMMGVRDCSGAGRVEGDALGAQRQMARRRIYEGDDGHVVMELRGGRWRQRVREWWAALRLLRCLRREGRHVLALACAVRALSGSRTCTCARNRRRPTTASAAWPQRRDRSLMAERAFPRRSCTRVGSIDTHAR